MFPRRLPRHLVGVFSFTKRAIFSPFVNDKAATLTTQGLREGSVKCRVGPSFIGCCGRGMSGIYLFSASAYRCAMSSSYFSGRRGFEILPCIFGSPRGVRGGVSMGGLRFNSGVSGSDGRERRCFSIGDVVSPGAVLLDGKLAIELVKVGRGPSTGNGTAGFLLSEAGNQGIFLGCSSMGCSSRGVLLYCLCLSGGAFVGTRVLGGKLTSMSCSVSFGCGAGFRGLVGMWTCKWMFGRF